jgi:hypothetical protein
MVHIAVLSLAESVLAVRPPYAPAPTGDPESASSTLKRPEVPVS